MNKARKQKQITFIIQYLYFMVNLLLSKNISYCLWARLTQLLNVVTGGHRYGFHPNIFVSDHIFSSMHIYDVLPPNGNRVRKMINKAK